MEEELTQEELEMLDQLGAGGGYPKEESKQNIFMFFKRIVDSKDTTRTANLDKDELGMAKIPVRTNLELSHYCKKMGLTGMGNFFHGEAQIISDSSLSKDGFLDRLAVTTTRQIESKTKKSQPRKKGLFSRREKEDGF